MSNLPADPLARKTFPVATGVMDYFPDALVAIAEVSYVGNQQHNPGQPLHWARGKSTDHADALVRHLIDRGRLDTDGMRHTAKAAWRALALLQTELEAEAATVRKEAKTVTGNPDTCVSGQSDGNGGPEPAQGISVLVQS